VSSQVPFVPNVSVSNGEPGSFPSDFLEKNVEEPPDILTLQSSYISASQSEEQIEEILNKISLMMKSSPLSSDPTMKIDPKETPKETSLLFLKPLSSSYQEDGKIAPPPSPMIFSSHSEKIRSQKLIEKIHDKFSKKESLPIEKTSSDISSAKHAKLKRLGTTIHYLVNNEVFSPQKFPDPPKKLRPSLAIEIASAQKSSESMDI
jgi:hypothetical protein